MTGVQTCALPISGKRVIRADGIGAADLLKAILPLFPLDTYEKDRFILMEVVPGDPVVPVIWDEYKEILNEQEPDTPVEFKERFAYYERAKNAYCVVATGETAQYANIILQQGESKRAHRMRNKNAGT